MSVVARLEEAILDPSEELAALMRCSTADGAVVSFVGVTRSTAAEGRPVRRLTLDHHPTLTAKSLEAIASAAAERFNVSHVRVVHRCGCLEPGEPIVFAGASSPHRRDAFEAADYLMDRLKTEAILWKREDGADGATWVEPTAADFSDRARWD
jgi:molybdopterin synthase catalytic subunit